LHVEYVSAASCGFFENIGAGGGLFIGVAPVQKKEFLSQI
jgi:hypothetical protein